MRTRPEGEYAVRVHPADWPTNPSAGVLEEHPLPGGQTLAEVWCVSGPGVCFDTRNPRGNPPDTHRAYLLDCGKFVAAPGLPPVTDFGKDRFDHQRHMNGKVTLATGDEVLVWDGAGYEWDGARFVRRWELEAREPGGIDGWVSVPWGADGFFYLSDRKLMYARRGRGPVSVHPDAENILHLSAGPGTTSVSSEPVPATPSDTSPASGSRRTVRTYPCYADLLSGGGRGWPSATRCTGARRPGASTSRRCRRSRIRPSPGWRAG